MVGPGEYPTLDSLIPDGFTLHSVERGNPDFVDYNNGTLDLSLLFPEVDTQVEEGK